MTFLVVFHLRPRWNVIFQHERVHFDVWFGRVFLPSLYLSLFLSLCFVFCFQFLIFASYINKFDLIVFAIKIKYLNIIHISVLTLWWWWRFACILLFLSMCKRKQYEKWIIKFKELIDQIPIQQSVQKQFYYLLTCNHLYRAFSFASIELPFKKFCI